MSETGSNQDMAARLELAPQPGQSRRRGRSSSIESDEPRAKRAKRSLLPKPKLYPWTEKSEALERALRPELRKTLGLLRLYAKDIPFALDDLLYSVGVPEFPVVQWDNVLRGRAVDLDHVLTDHYPHRAGVESVGDWVVAWGMAATATRYAFPHRDSELKGYEDHLISLFGAVAPAHHHRVIQYDKAVRTRVGRVRDVLLTDFNSFSEIRYMCISLGAGAHSS